MTIKLASAGLVFVAFGTQERQYSECTRSMSLNNKQYITIALVTVFLSVTVTVVELFKES